MNRSFLHNSRITRRFGRRLTQSWSVLGARADLATILLATTIGCSGSNTDANISSSGNPADDGSASAGVNGVNPGGRGGALGQGGTAQTGGAISVAFEPSTLSRTFRQGQPIAELVIKARLGRIPTNVTAKRVIDSLDFLTRTPSISVESDGSYMARLDVGTNREPGIYNGTYTLVLCKSNNCDIVQSLSPSSVPYTFTVTPLVSAAFRLDGVLQSQLTRGVDKEGEGWYRVDLKSGSQIEIESSLPVTWELSDGLMSDITDIKTPSPTTWRAVITLHDDIEDWIEDIIRFTGHTADQQGINVDVYVSR